MTTNIKVSDNVSISRNLAYGQGKNNKKYREIARQVDIATSYILKNIYPEIQGVDVTVKAIKGKYSGLAWNRHIQVDPRSLYGNIGTLRSTISILIHELCHVNQRQTGKMEYKFNNNLYKWESRWDMADFIPVKYNLKRQEYFDQPWEVEARAAEKKYIKEVMNVLTPNL